MHLLLRQRKARIVKAILRLPRPGHAPPCVIVITGDLNVVLVELDKLAQITGDREGLPLVHEAVHGLRTLLAIGDGVNRKPCAVVDVPSGKNVRFRRLERHGVTDNSSAAPYFSLCALQKIAPHCRLADCLQHRPAGNRDRRFLIVLRIKAAFGIFDLRALLEYHAGHPSVLCEDLFRAPAVFHLDALSLCVFHFIRGCRHLISTFQADHGDVSACHASRGPCHVDRHVPAADHHSVAGELHAVIAVYAVQEANPGLHAFCILARNTGTSSAGKTD